MEKIVDKIVFRRITYADFRHINKVGGEEPGGGGQSYIDFPVRNVPLNFWDGFLGKRSGSNVNGWPIWNIKIRSFGLDDVAKSKIFQRRLQSVSISSQKIYSRRSNRVPSWHPDNGFPDNLPENHHDLVVYIVKTTYGEYWAGWINQSEPEANWQVNDQLMKLFTEESAESISIDGTMFIETINSEWPFYFKSNAEKHYTKTEEEVINTSFEEDHLEKINELSREEKERIIRVKARNTRIIKNLKRLYKGNCQISGDQFTFKKKNGEYYSEAHHLIALGEGGSDDYRNIIIVSSLIHRMLHYAKVSEIDLTQLATFSLKIHRFQ